MKKDLFVKHGGVHFTATASPEAINTFIRDLPSSKKDNLYEVLKELDISAEDQEC